jgi:hypothetical protein
MWKAARFRLMKRARKNPMAVNLVKEVVDLGAEDAKDTNLLKLPHQTEICCGGVACARHFHEYIGILALYS